MIDREKVIEKLESLRDICNAKSDMAVGNGKIAWAGYANAADDALALLKVQEPKRGKWVKMTGMMPPEYHGHYQCSECGWHLKGLRNSWTREEDMEFCPGCGLPMTKGGEMDEP